MFNVFTGSSRLDTIISFCVYEHRLAVYANAKLRNGTHYAPETNCKIESTLVTLALHQNIHFKILHHKGRFLRSYHICSEHSGHDRIGARFSCNYRIIAKSYYI